MSCFQQPFRVPSRGANQEEAIALVASTRRPRPRICRSPDLEGGGLTVSHPRFGPFYCENDSGQKLKEDAWQHVLKKTEDDETKTKEMYMSLIRKVEKEARETYGYGALNNNMTEAEFRWMMIKDGCFLLQLALCVLGGQSHLSYSSEEHLIFSKKQNEKDMNRWIESIFFVGNQIPLVVLTQLMKQRFFQDVISKGKWKPPSNLSKRVLYELLLLPALETGPTSHLGTFSTLIRELTQKMVLTKKHAYLQQQQPCDLLHGLQLLVVGPGGDLVEEEGEKGELEDGRGAPDPVHRPPLLPEGDGSYQDPTNLSDAFSDQTVGEAGPEDHGDAQSICSATELSQAGINFKIDKEIGSRGIRFKSNFFNGVLTLSIFKVDDETELLFQYLKIYEKTHQVANNRSEVSCYLQFMSELVRTAQDVKLLASYGVIEANLKQREKLPRMLSRLAKDTDRKETCQNLRYVRLQIKDFSRLPWEKFKQVLSIVVVLSLVQTIFTILQYFKGR